MELNPFELNESKPLTKDRDYYDYMDLVNSISDKITWFIEGGFKDYQGDYFFLGKDDEENYYYIVGGYGSCSGCDVLQACDSLEEVIALRDDIKSGIRKFKSIDEFETWFNTHAQTEWYNKEDAIDFIERANSQLPLILKWRDND